MISQRVTDSKGKPLYKIHQIAIDISTFEVQTIYETDELLYEVINYGFDEVEKVIVFLKQDKSKNKSKPKYFVTIVDILDDDQIKVLFNERITQPRVIGRLKSGMYMIVNGHIYFNNEVIKIRYDLLKQENSTKEYRETQIFDIYKDILKFDMSKG